MAKHVKLSEQEQRQLDELIRKAYQDNPAGYDDGIVAGRATTSGLFNGQIIKASLVKKFRKILGIKIRGKRGSAKKEKLIYQHKAAGVALNVGPTDETELFLEVLKGAKQLSPEGRAFLKRVL